MNGWFKDRVRMGITGVFGDSGEVIIKEEWFTSVLKEGYVWVIHNSSTITCISTLQWLESMME